MARTNPATIAAYRVKRRSLDAVRQARIREMNRVDLRAFKWLRGCADCGYDANADALQFDHRPGERKAQNVSRMTSNTVGMIREIAKCDVVCANCHAIRTATRRKAA